MLGEEEEEGGGGLVFARENMKLWLREWVLFGFLNFLLRLLLLGLVLVLYLLDLGLLLVLVNLLVVLNLLHVTVNIPSTNV